MKIISTYKVRLGKNIQEPLEPTLELYRKAVGFFADVIDREWKDIFSSCGTVNDTVRVCEHLTVETKSNPEPRYNFTLLFYKFPCYLRRSAITKAYGMISSYRSNLANWENAKSETRGMKPSKPTIGMCFPAMYRDNCFVRTGTYTARLKAFVRNTWDWVDVTLRKCDVDYILRHCKSCKECVPTLTKRGKNWSLDFAFERSSKLSDAPVEERRIVAVDLGINNTAVCSVMEPDGTVIGREFLSLKRENDCLKHALKLIRRAQKAGASRKPKLNAKALGISRRISELTAGFIHDVAVGYGADCVVMEHLDVSGRKRGSRKERLHRWGVKRIQGIVTHKCHCDGIRVSTVCAINTSRLAFDGSGEVKRGRASAKTGGSYSVCEFPSGKMYNCDLNASYNIGARYYIREILGLMPERARSEAEAKVPSLLKRSTCTLSDLKGLRAVLRGGMAAADTERVMSGKARDSRAPKGQTDGSRRYGMHATLVV